jgi:dolichol-phosphate mannosyltransferase
MLRAAYLPSPGRSPAPDVARSKLGVAAPLANEEATIDAFLDRVVAQLDADDRVFCVLDTVSRDATRERIEAHAALDDRVRLVWAPANRCVVDAYFAGDRAALDDGCCWILEMDGGLSHLPEEIPRFVEAMSTGIDFAAGSRFVAGSQLSTTPYRYVLSRGGTWLANALVGTRMRDMTSGFECFTRDALESVIEHGVRSRANFFQTEIRALMHEWNWVEVPITYHSPSGRVGSATVSEALSNLWKLRGDMRARIAAR